MKWITLLRDNGRGNRNEYRTVFRAIWRKGSPHTVLGKILPTLLLFGPMFSPSQFFISEEKSCEAEQSATRLMDYYICFFAVQNRAFELYQQRGAGPGDSVHDWLRAEEEILFRNSKKTSG